MKKLSSLIILVLAAVLLFCFTACDFDPSISFDRGDRSASETDTGLENDSVNGIQLNKLPAPSGLYVETSGERFRWHPGSHETGYSVRIVKDGSTLIEYRPASNGKSPFYYLPELADGTYILMVKANGDGVKYADSDWAFITHTVENGGGTVHEHNFGDWTVTIAPACTEPGLEKRVCSEDPSHIELRSVDALGHDWEWVVTKPATETENGIETKICRNDNSHTDGTRVLYANVTDGLEYILNEDGTEYSVSRGTVRSGAVIIPALREGLPVTEIADRAFFDSYNALTITSVWIPASVKNIGNSAFHTCAKLKSVIFESGSGLEHIDSNAFSNSGVESIIIPASVKVIGLAAFVACTGLTSVIFEDGSALNYIGERAFGYTGLENITIPESVTVIDPYAFRESAKLKSVVFENGSKLKHIGFAMFYGCTGLETVTLPVIMESHLGSVFLDIENLIIIYV